MIRRLVFILAVLVLVGLMASAQAETAGNAVPEIGVHTNVPRVALGAREVSVILTGEKRQTADPEAWKAEIRYVPFDRESGLFDTETEQAPDGRAEFVRWLDDGYGYTVRLTVPGKYILSGIPFYVLDPLSEPQAALFEELDINAEKTLKKTQKDTAEALYSWLMRRVNGKLPEDQPEMADICRDPMNCLLTGYAAPEAYAPLLQLILDQSGIDSVMLDGQVVRREDEWDGTWIACRLDGTWVYDDPALDDRDNGNRNAYFARDRESFEKDHVHSEASLAFLRDMLGSNYMDVLLSGENRDLEQRLKRKTVKEGYRLDWFLFDSPMYSLGPSGPVTIRIISNYEHSWNPDPEEISIPDYIRDSLCLFERYEWSEEAESFPTLVFNTASNPDYDTADDITVLSYNEDLTEVVVQFNTPGIYYLKNAQYFCVLDPAHETQARIGAMLEEARESCQGETERETAKKLQDWEASVLAYDHPFYNEKKQIERGNIDADIDWNAYERKANSVFDAFGALARGMTVCEGYTRIYHMLLQGSGIFSFHIAGNKVVRDEGHAWILFRTDGEWLYADPTWDDIGNTSGKQYFAQTQQQYKRHHGTDFCELNQSFLEEMIDNPVYTEMIRLFDTRYAPKLVIPEALRILPADASGYGFPAEMPEYVPFQSLESDGSSITSDTTREDVHAQYILCDITGMPYEVNTSNFKKSKQPSTICSGISGYVCLLNIMDYSPLKDRPTDRATHEGRAVYYRGEPVFAEYEYAVPMKKNEIRGYSEKSRRSWTYDREGRKIASSWALEKDGTFLTVTARFDAEEQTSGYDVSYEQGSGNSTAWSVTGDGLVTGLVIVQDDRRYTLTDLTERWTDPCYQFFVKKVLAEYPALSADAPLPEGVHVYQFAETINDLARKRLDGTPIVTADPLFVWTEGGLQLNRDARDLNGDPIVLPEFEEMDLSCCVQLSVAAGPDMQGPDILP